MMQRRVARDSLKGDCVVQNKVREEATVLTAPRRIVRKKETVSFEVFPK